MFVFEVNYPDKLMSKMLEYWEDEVYHTFDLILTSLFQTVFIFPNTRWVLVERI